MQYYVVFDLRRLSSLPPVPPLLTALVIRPLSCSHACIIHRTDSLNIFVNSTLDVDTPWAFTMTNADYTGYDNSTVPPEAWNLKVRTLESGLGHSVKLQYSHRRCMVCNSQD